MTPSTSPQVASIAGGLLKEMEAFGYRDSAWVYAQNVNGDLFRLTTVRELKAVFTALAQVKDKKKRKKSNGRASRQ